MTFEEAIIIGERELARAFYDIDCAKNRGLAKIAENKADWLSVLLYMAKQYMKSKEDKKDVVVQSRRMGN